MAERNSDTVTANDRELVITRVFDAPRDLVWKAWTEPERIKQWSAPKGFTIPVAEGELRPGGAWKSCMRKPDGTDLWLAGVYREIEEPKRLVFTHAWLDEHGDPGPETVVTVTLVERGGKTEMTFRQSGFDSADSRDGHAGGWNECFDRLDELLARR
ncbi:MAG TPA: SRPBCC domain-containing protein [Gemmatimonadaceae bacterium]|nr:SRPBCC domain-containing protein [Gemmatimonadaceae bacterium]